MRYTPRRPCARCGRTRTTNSRTPDLCTSCRSLQERVDPGADQIEWHKDGLIQRGTVQNPADRQ